MQELRLALSSPWIAPAWRYRHWLQDDVLFSIGFLCTCPSLLPHRPHPCCLPISQVRQLHEHQSHRGVCHPLPHRAAWQNGSQQPLPGKRGRRETTFILKFCSHSSPALRAAISCCEEQERLCAAHMATSDYATWSLWPEGISSKWCGKASPGHAVSIGKATKLLLCIKDFSLQRSYCG